MAYCPLFEIASFDEQPPRTRCFLVLGLVRALVDINVAYLKAHPETPGLYESGVIYRQQQTVAGAYTGIDMWWDIPQVLSQGEGSCEDLAAWRVAELQIRGKGSLQRNARPFVHSKSALNGDTVYHVVVKDPEGREEDPSVLLGMWPVWTP